MNAGAAVAGSGMEDPLAFVASSLAARGGLVERDGDFAIALLPPDLSREIGVPEESRLATYPETPGDVAAGIGSPLLEKLVSAARRVSPFANARVDLEPPRPGHARAQAERFELRNGLAEIKQITLGTGTYLWCAVAYAAEADDRREGMFAVASAADGAEPDDTFVALIDPGRQSHVLSASRQPISVSSAARWIAARAAIAVRAATASLETEVARRHARDHARIADYFAALVAEARAPRRRADPQAIEAKIQHLLAERDKKIADLPARFAMRVTTEIAAAAAVEAPVALVELRLRRRKEERGLVLHLPAGAKGMDRPPCSACGKGTLKPAACDGALHLLCETCVPNPQGRFACPQCG